MKTRKWLIAIPIALQAFLSMWPIQSIVLNVRYRARFVAIGASQESIDAYTKGLNGAIGLLVIFTLLIWTPTLIVWLIRKAVRKAKARKEPQAD